MEYAFSRNQECLSRKIGSLVDREGLSDHTFEKITEMLDSNLEVVTGTLNQTIELLKIEIDRLYESEQEKKYLAAIVEETEDVAFILDPKGRLITGNKSFLKLTGTRDLSEVAGKEYDELFQGLIQNNPAIGFMREDGEAMSLARGSFIEREFSLLDDDGKRRFFLSRKFPIFEGPGPVLAIATIARDITGIKSAQLALEESHKKCQLLFENASDKVFLVEVDDHMMPGRFLDINKAVSSSLQYTREELLCMTVRDIDFPENWARVPGLMKILLTEKHYTFETAHRKKDGRVLPVEVSAHLFTLGEKQVILAISRDISARKRREQDLIYYQKRLQALSSEICFVEERERRKIASKLHDSISQNLATSKLRLELMASRSGDPSVKEEIGKIIPTLEKTLSSTRNLMFDLSPPVLYELGFKAALEWLGEAVEKEHGLKVHVTGQDLPGELDDDIRSFLFRAVQELVTNVIRHARAEVVQIRVFTVGKDIAIKVRDNGEGIDPEKVMDREKICNTFGLFSIRERIRSLGGTMIVQSLEDGGTQVALSLPWS